MDIFGYPEFDRNGRKTLTRTKGPYAYTLMDITVYHIEKGQTLSFPSGGEEKAVLLIEGSILYTWPGNSVSASRGNFIKDGAFCLHVCKNIAVEVTAVQKSEILVQSTENARIFESSLYTPRNCMEETFGQNQFEGKTKRTVRTFFDYHTAPYSNMVMGEIIVPQGGWSSYPPHHHPQPEVYYYRFDKPQGFGACFIGNDVNRITDGSFCSVPSNLTHPQVNAPGYPMYYVWMIRHLEGNPWTERIYAPEHEWLLKRC